MKYPIIDVLLIWSCFLINLGFLPLPTHSAPSACVYGEIDLEGQIQQLKEWMSETHQNGRTDDWWLASYLAVSNFNITPAEAHIARYYNFKERYPKVLQEREWFISFLQDPQNELSEEAQKSNELILQLLDSGFLLTMFDTPEDGDTTSIIRFGVVPDQVPFKDAITLLTMYWDMSFSFTNPFLVQSALNWSKLVCEGETVPFSTTTNKCKNLSGYGITKPNSKNVTLILAEFIEGGSQFVAEMVSKFVVQYRAGATVIVDTNGLPDRRMLEFASIAPALAECLSVYPFLLNSIHIFNNNKEMLKEAFEEASEQQETTYSSNIQLQLQKIYLHGGDYSILSKCGIPQQDLPKEYGGLSGTIEELSIIWKALIMGAAQAYEEENKFF